jgi:hypothetical protein
VAPRTDGRQVKHDLFANTGKSRILKGVSPSEQPRAGVPGLRMRQTALMSPLFTIPVAGSTHGDRGNG